MEHHGHKQEIKKDRHSAQAKKESKKGGGGGKGVWGIGGVDDLRTNPADREDPNYDSGEDEEVVFKKTEVTSPFESIIHEYLVSGDTEEVAKSLVEAKLDLKLGQFVKKALTIALEKQAYERELVSKLLSELYGKVISAEMIAEGFELALNSLDELKLDNPDAVEVLAKFLARAVMDEVVAPVFLKHTATTLSSPNAQEAVALANALTTERHRSERLEHVWGPGDLTSVKRLKEEASLLVREYLVNGDTDEADRAVRKLNAPSFHPQLVKQAIRLALQQSTEEQRKKISSLLSFFAKEGLVSPDHMTRGFQLAQASISDFQLDIPSAGTLFEQFVALAKEQGYLPSF